MNLKTILILLISLTITNCNTDDNIVVEKETLFDQYGNTINENSDIVECGPNPGCPPPFISQAYFYFQLIDSNNQTIELNENNIKEINWILQGSDLNQQLNFDISQNIGFVELGEQSSELIESQNYMLNSGFGFPQIIQVKLDSKALFENKCNPCSEYFISSINQNENEVIFSGELTNNDIINIRVE